MKLPITLPSLRVAWLELPAPLTELEYDTISRAIESWKTALVQAAPPKQEEQVDSGQDDT